VVRTSCGKLELTRGSFNIGIRGEHFDVLFSILQGGLVSFRRGGNPFAGGGMTGCAGGPAFGRDALFTGCELFEKMPRPCFWRAPTSNDMGNHMAVIQGLIESGDRDAANDYIGEWSENMNNLEMSVKTGNPFTDVAISGFADRFEETGISFDQSFVYPENLHINPFDLCVVLSNALQNAYEASVNVDDPYVSLTSVLKKNTFIINVRNRIGLEIDIDKETGLPYSSKKEDGHGYGLKNIRNVAQKYNGDIDIRQEHDGHGLIFILNVMMIG
jgi:hypothetical protein